MKGCLPWPAAKRRSARAEPVDLAGLAGDCITDLHARAVERQIDVRDSLAPAWVRGEPALLERMIANLLDNAIRHNVPRGFLEVETGSEDGHVTLRVANGGQLIDAADVDSLAEPFRRLRRDEDGFGLGLSIVRSVAQVHGGSVRCLRDRRVG